MRMGAGNVFLWYCAAGGLLGAVFDGFRLCRRMIRHPTAAVVVEDVMFALVLFLSSFYGLVTKTDGIFRWIFLAGEAIGFLIYQLTISRLILKILESVLRWMIRMIQWILRPCVWLFRFIGRKCMVLIKKLIFFIKNSNHLLAKRKQNDV